MKKPGPKKISQLKLYFKFFCWILLLFLPLILLLPILHLFFLYLYFGGLQDTCLFPYIQDIPALRDARTPNYLFYWIVAHFGRFYVNGYTVSLASCVDYDAMMYDHYVMEHFLILAQDKDPNMIKIISDFFFDYGFFTESNFICEQGHNFYILSPYDPSRNYLTIYLLLLFLLRPSFSFLTILEFLTVLYLHMFITYCPVFLSIVTILFFSIYIYLNFLSNTINNWNLSQEYVDFHLRCSKFFNWFSKKAFKYFLYIIVLILLFELIINSFCMFYYGYTNWLPFASHLCNTTFIYTEHFKGYSHISLILHSLDPNFFYVCATKKPYWVYSDLYANALEHYNTITISEIASHLSATCTTPIPITDANKNVVEAFLQYLIIDPVNNTFTLKPYSFFVNYNRVLDSSHILTLSGLTFYNDYWIKFHYFIFRLFPLIIFYYIILFFHFNKIHIYLFFKPENIYEYCFSNKLIPTIFRFIYTGVLIKNPPINKNYSIRESKLGMSERAILIMDFCFLMIPIAFIFIFILLTIINYIIFYIINYFLFTYCSHPQFIHFLCTIIIYIESWFS